MIYGDDLSTWKTHINRSNARLHIIIILFINMELIVSVGRIAKENGVSMYIKLSSGSTKVVSIKLKFIQKQIAYLIGYLLWLQLNLFWHKPTHSNTCHAQFAWKSTKFGVRWMDIMCKFCFVPAVNNHWRYQSINMTVDNGYRTLIPFLTILSDSRSLIVRVVLATLFPIRKNSA